MPCLRSGDRPDAQHRKFPIMPCRSRHPSHLGAASVVSFYDHEALLGRTSFLNYGFLRMKLIPLDRLGCSRFLGLRSGRTSAADTCVQADLEQNPCQREETLIASNTRDRECLEVRRMCRAGAPRLRRCAYLLVGSENNPVSSRLSSQPT